MRLEFYQTMAVVAAALIIATPYTFPGIAIGNAARNQVPGVYDVDSKAAAAQRKKQFARAETSRRLVAGAHLPFPGIGHLRAEDRGYTWVPLDYRWREQ